MNRFPETAEERELREKWNSVYRAAVVDAPPEPSRVLAENAHLLPRAGRALDLASGLGGNALFLARQGLETQAYDISDVATARLDELAARLALPVRTEVRDVIRLPPPTDAFDVIVLSRFLDRSLVPALILALKPGGLLFYQTFVRDKDPTVGPGNSAYLLGPNELLNLFRELRLVVYREEGGIGDPGRGFRNEAMLVGQRCREAAL